MKAIILALGLAAAAIGCAAEGDELEGIDVDGMSFHICGPDMGVYPDTSVLADPDNPFAARAIGEETKWELESRAGVIPAFYAWATLTARRPTGEHQYYAALNLKAIYDRELAPAAQLENARQLAIRGFQAVLDHFPEAVTYDASGTIAYELVTPSYKAIVALGGTVDGWILVQTADGGERAVPL